jgi:hypothetical protein
MSHSEFLRDSCSAFDRRHAAQLRSEISARNREGACAHEISCGPSASVLFHEVDGGHGNFLSAFVATHSGKSGVEGTAGEGLHREPLHPEGAGPEAA